MLICLAMHECMMHAMLANEEQAARILLARNMFLWGIHAHKNVHACTHTHMCICACTQTCTFVCLVLCRAGSASTRQLHHWPVSRVLLHQPPRHSAAPPPHTPARRAAAAAQPASPRASRQPGLSFLLVRTVLPGWIRGPL